MTFPKVKVYTIYASTGCSCCSYDNHDRGAYVDKSAAERRASKFRSISLLISQYSKTGNYQISEHNAELLPDNRVILDTDQVVKLHEVNETGEITGEFDSDRID